MTKTKIFLFHHFPEECVHFDGKEYSAHDGIPRVMRLVAKALNDSEKYEVIVTARFDQKKNFQGFFNSKIYTLFCFKPFTKIGRALEKRLGKRFLVWLINTFYKDSICLIPHYHLFPECLKLEVKSVLYLPDFTPHFFKTSGEFGDHSKETLLGKQLAKKSVAIFTNSAFSANYLPQTDLQVEKNKIHMFYLPNLNSENEIKEITTLNNVDFLFYPTQPRQNKKLDVLLRVFENLCETNPNLKLVLTSHFPADSRYRTDFAKMKYKNNVLFLPQISDGQIAALYKKATALVLTSTMEGNFPPQVFEALYHRTPVVATRLPLIQERIPGLEDHLLLCDAENESQFIAAIKRCLNNRQAIIEKQEKVRELILHQGSIAKFNNEVVTLFDLVNGA